MAGSVWRVRDELWEAVEPLLPEHPPDPRGGRPRVDDRACFNAIVFVLFTGSHGGISRRRWAARRRPRTAGSLSGRPSVCGKGCIANFYDG